MNLFLLVGLHSLHLSGFRKYNKILFMFLILVLRKNQCKSVTISFSRHHKGQCKLKEKRESWTTELCVDTVWCRTTDVICTSYPSIWICWTNPIKPQDRQVFEPFPPQSVHGYLYQSHTWSMNGEWLISVSFIIHVKNDLDQCLQNNTLGQG